MDYAEVVLHPGAKSAFPPPSALPLSPASIAGIVLGIVGGLAFLTLGMWCLFTTYRRRNRGRYLVDLLAPGHGTEDSLTRECHSVQERDPGVTEPYIVDASTHLHISWSSAETPTNGDNVRRAIQPLPKRVMRPGQAPIRRPDGLETHLRSSQAQPSHEIG